MNGGHPIEVNLTITVEVSHGLGQLIQQLINAIERHEGAYNDPEDESNSTD